MTKLTTLTPEQETLLSVVRDEWIAHGLSTERADRSAAEGGVRAAYRAAGLEPPRFMIWLGSPWAGVVGQAVAPEIVADGLRHRGQVDGQVYGQVYGQVGDQVGDQVDGQVYRQVYRQVHGQVYGQVHGQVHGQVYRQVDGQELKSRLSTWWRGRIMGQHWAGYYSHYDAMGRLGVTGLEPIRGAQQVARNAGWWWCHRDFAILTDRPEALHRDQVGRLHREDGMAIRYRDGWGFYAWHGRRVPEWVVMAPTVEQIGAERNAEVRRCAIESMGWDRFIQDAQLRAVDRCADPGNPGFGIALYDVPEEVWGERVRVLLCANGTVERDGARRRFGLTVPEEITTALDAAAWGYGLTGAEYAQLEVRR
ncbi:MAG TPA: hypothetical protein VGG83_10615 [Trebonia sp.]